MKKFVLLLSVALLFSNCKKDEHEHTPEPQNKTFSYNLTFAAGSTYEEYNGVTGFDANDVLLTYMFTDNFGQNFYTLIPITSDDITFYPEFSENSGQLFINAIWADGTAGSVFASSVTFSFKTVLIKSSAIANRPDVDLNNYKEVVKAFNL